MVGSLTVVLLLRDITRPQLLTGGFLFFFLSDVPLLFCHRIKKGVCILLAC